MPLAALLLAAATPTVPIPPAGPWVIRAEEDLCRLARLYPVADQKVTLVFQPLLDLDSMELFTLSPDRSDRQYSGKFSISNERGAQTYSGGYFSVPMGKTRTRLTRLTVERAALGQLKDGDTLRLKAAPVDLAFKIVRPEQARVVLQNCIDDLKKSWGVDPAMASRVATPVRNPASYLTSDDYPSEAVAQGIYGRVIAFLNINAEGAVEHCRIVSSAGAVLNDGTCKVAMRIKFKPPRDDGGRPLPSTYVLPIRWVIPGAPD